MPAIRDHQRFQSGGLSDGTHTHTIPIRETASVALGPLPPGAPPVCEMFRHYPDALER